MSAVALYWLFLRAVLLSFSGFATVPALREALVLHAGVLSDARLNDAIAIGQASPGPLGLYIVVVGYFVDGLPGAVAGGLALASPALLAIPLGALVARGQSSRLQGACAGIVIASCALMMVTGVRLAAGAGLAGWQTVALGAGVIALMATSVKPVWIILASALLGLVLGP